MREGMNFRCACAKVRYRETEPAKTAVFASAGSVIQNPSMNVADEPD